MLLHKYKDIFQQPHGLPPSSTHDHSILLLPNTIPMRVHPYRYPHSQKTKIERLVSEMLVEGIIRPSSSPFSLPMLLTSEKER